MRGDEPRGARRNTDAVTAPLRADGKKRSRGIRSPGAGVEACHHSTEKSFRCACFRFHQWGSPSDAQIGPPTLSCACGRTHRRGGDGPERGSEWYDHNERRKPCPGQEAWAPRHGSVRARSRKGGGSEPARSSKEDGTDTDENGDDANSAPGVSKSGESVSMPPAVERPYLGPGHSALHQRVLHANLGRTAGAPQRLRAPEKRTLGGHLGHIPYRLRAGRGATRTEARARGGLNGATSEPRERDRARAARRAAPGPATSFLSAGFPSSLGLDDPAAPR